MINKSFSCFVQIELKSFSCLIYSLIKKLFLYLSVWIKNLLQMTHFKWKRLLHFSVQFNYHLVCIQKRFLYQSIPIKKYVSGMKSMFFQLKLLKNSNLICSDLVPGRRLESHAHQFMPAFCVSKWMIHDWLTGLFISRPFAIHMRLFAISPSELMANYQLRVEL